MTAERRMRRHVVAADGQAHAIELSGIPVAVAASGSGHGVEFWSEDIPGAARCRDLFRVFGTGEPLPDGAAWAGTCRQEVTGGRALHLYRLRYVHLDRERYGGPRCGAPGDEPCGLTADPREITCPACAALAGTEPARQPPEPDGPAEEVRLVEVTRTVVVTVRAASPDAAAQRGAAIGRRWAPEEAHGADQGTTRARVISQEDL
jgi:hypothetical protein